MQKELALGLLLAAGLNAQDRIFGLDGQYEGASIAVAGDTNRDGYPDWITGSLTLHGRGSATLYSGKSGGILATFYGATDGDLFGMSVASAGDVNRDGYADVVVGAPLGFRTGYARVYSGKDHKLLYTFRGDALGDSFGESVACAGDWNRDGNSDVIVGGKGNDWKAFDSGMARVYSGKDGKVLGHYNGTGVSDKFGSAVAGAGDINKDGHDDALIAARLANTAKGYVRVVSGRDGKTLYTFVGDSNFDEFGTSVAGGHDLDRDGYPDVLVGAQSDDNNGLESGSVRAFSGKTGKVLFTWNGSGTLAKLGTSVAFAGDLDRDGYVDWMTGTHRTGSSRTAYVEVISGRTGKLLKNIFPPGLLGNVVLAGGHDINRDGAPDILVAAGAYLGWARVYSFRPLSLTSDRHLLFNSHWSTRTQTLRIDVGSKHAGRNYWLFGSATGMHPGTALANVVVPLNLDPYTSIAMEAVNTFVFTGFRGKLDASGMATAKFNLITNLPAFPFLDLFHAAVIYDANGIYATTNAAPVHIRH